MKKALSILLCVLFARIVLLPAGEMISYCIGCTFTLTNESVFSIITALLAISSVVLSFIVNGHVGSKAIRVLCTLLAPLSLISAAFHMIFYTHDICIVVSIMVNIGCCCFLTGKLGKTIVLQILSFGLVALIIMPIFFLGFLAFVFGDFAQNTVVKSVISPSGTYYAEVIDSDQGALGGDTLVDVYTIKRIDAVIFKISKKPQRVYTGEWREHMRMEIHWKDDSCLVINNVEHKIE